MAGCEGAWVLKKLKTSSFSDMQCTSPLQATSYFILLSLQLVGWGGMNGLRMTQNSQILELEGTCIKKKNSRIPLLGH